MYYSLINHKYKFVCFWNAKCGCTAVKGWFLSTLGILDKLKYLLNVVRRGRFLQFLKHGYVVQIHNFFGYDKGRFSIKRDELDKKYDNYYKFIVVRNPWRRLVSYYADKIVIQKSLDVCVVNTKTREKATNLTFRQLIKLIEKTSDNFLEAHIQPQALGIEYIDFDYIVKVENINTDMQKVCDDLKLPFKGIKNPNPIKYIEPLDKVTVCDLLPESFDIHRIPTYEVFYDEELKKIAANKYKKDIKHFSYKFED